MLSGLYWTFDRLAIATGPRRIARHRGIGVIHSDGERLAKKWSPPGAVQERFRHRPKKVSRTVCAVHGARNGPQGFLPKFLSLGRFVRLVAGG